MSGPPAGVVTLAPGTGTQMAGVPLPPGPGGTLAPDGTALASIRAPATTRPASTSRSVIDIVPPIDWVAPVWARRWQHARARWQLSTSKGAGRCAVLSCTAGSHAESKADERHRALPDFHEQPPGTTPRSRTDPNGSGCPHMELRIKRSRYSGALGGSPPLVFYHPAACAARGRIFPAPAGGTPHPVIVVPLAPFCGDCSQDRSQAIGRRSAGPWGCRSLLCLLTVSGMAGRAARPTTMRGRS